MFSSTYGPVNKDQRRVHTEGLDSLPDTWLKVAEGRHVHLPSPMSLALQGGSVMMENKPAGLKLMMTLGLATLGQRAFMNRTVGEILWGYDDPFVNLINKYFPDMFPIKGKFGLFVEVSVFRPHKQL